MPRNGEQEACGGIAWAGRIPAVLVILLALTSDRAELHAMQAEQLIRDSAGVEIVASFQPQWAPGQQWQIDATPTFAVKSGDGSRPAEFTRVLDVVRLPDGTTVVADAGRGSVEFFPEDSRHLHSTGRSVSDTARFSRLSSLQMVDPEILLAFDAENRRATLFNVRGEILQEVELERVGKALPLHVFPVRRPILFVVTGGVPTTDSTHESPTGRDPTPLLLYSLDGTLMDTVAVVPGGEYLRQSRDGRPSRGLVVFGRHTLTTARLGKILIGTGDLFEILEYGSDAVLRRVIRLPDFDLTLQQSDIDAEREAWLEAASSRPPMRGAVVEAPVAARRPAYLDAEIDSEGNLWVAEYRTLPALGDPVKWYVFDGAGRWLGVVNSPPDFRIMDVGSDFVAGRYRREVGREEVRIHRLIKT